MKWLKVGLVAAGAVLAGATLTFAVLALGGTAQAQQGPGEKASRFLELLAQQLGIGTDQLKNAATNARNQLVDELVASGDLTQAQADKIKSSEQVFGGFMGPPFHIRGGVHAFVNVAEITANVSGISLETLKNEMQQGKSFAQIASEHGVSRDALKNAITNAQKTQLQNAVSNGKLTQQQADQISQNLAEHLDQMIDSTHKFGIMKMHRGMATPTP